MLPPLSSEIQRYDGVILQVTGTDGSLIRNLKISPMPCTAIMHIIGFQMHKSFLEAHIPLACQ
jgi:hypothetical protein